MKYALQGHHSSRQLDHRLARLIAQNLKANAWTGAGLLRLRSIREAAIRIRSERAALSRSNIAGQVSSRCWHRDAMLFPCICRNEMNRVFGQGNETEPDPSLLLPKADEAALRPDAATLMICLHNGYTVRMLRGIPAWPLTAAAARSQGVPVTLLQARDTNAKACFTEAIIAELRCMWLQYVHVHLLLMSCIFAM